jgi:thymidine phosphorylase
VRAGQPLATLLTDTAEAIPHAEEALAGAFTIKPLTTEPLTTGKGQPRRQLVLDLI